MKKRDDKKEEEIVSAYSNEGKKRNSSYKITKSTKIWMIIGYVGLFLLCIGIIVVLEIYL